MTRRIALSILLTVWLALLLAGVLAYYVTRGSLIADLDATLLGRIVSLPEVERPGSFSRVTAVADARDQFVIHDAQGSTVARPSAGRSDVPEPEIISRSFSTLDDGSWIRTLRVKVFARRISPDTPLQPITITYRGNADHLRTLLSQLAWSLGIYGLLASIATSAVAVVVAKAALRPLNATSETIGQIDETRLDRRIEVHRLPPELAAVGARLNEMLSRLQAAFTQRKQFLADASHELRTPVAAILTTLEVSLHKKRAADDYKRTLESCLADARALNHLVSSLLDHVRGERFGGGGSEPAEFSPVDISSLLNHCADMAATLGGPKKVQVRRDIPAGLIGLSDELKLRSIVSNLLSNAVEYSRDEGIVNLGVVVGEPKSPQLAKLESSKPESLITNSRTVVIRVSDNGPGIAPAHLAHLFEPFYRADQARSQVKQHLGLGLFIVKNHVQSLDGECHVDSPITPDGKGSMFTVKLPMLILPALDDNNPAGALRDNQAPDHITK